MGEGDNRLGIVDLIENTIRADPYAILEGTGRELLAQTGPWFVSKRLNDTDDLQSDIPGQGANILLE